MTIQESVEEMEKVIHESFVNNLTTCRAFHRISQKSLSESTGISESHLTKIQTGVSGLTLFTMCRVAKFFNVSVFDMMAKDFDARLSSVQIETSPVVEMKKIYFRPRKVYTRKPGDTV